MSGLLDLILKNDDAVKRLASHFDLGHTQTAAALSQLIPALATGVKKNIGKKGGLEAVLGAIARGDHERYLDNPDQLAAPANREEGQKILGHLFGDKQVSREVARRGAENTGLDERLLRKMLPFAAGMFMGSMKKQSAEQGLSAQAYPTPDAAGALGKMLEQGGEGSVADDLLGFAKKLF